jgi:AraC-like DNA-binding protein
MLANMKPSPASWVPPGAWLTPQYAEWQPPGSLRGPVACLWASFTPDRPQGTGLILPDGCTDLIWQEGVGASVAGPDTGPVSNEPVPGAVFVGVRFRPAAGGQVLGLPLNELRDQRVPLEDVLKGAAAWLTAALTPAEAAAGLLRLTGRLVAGSAADPAMTRAASLLRDPAARTEDIADQLGLSERQLRRRSQAAAGYGPKTLQRVLRFQRFVRLLDASPALPGLADAAARAGYADQPHLTRECRALSGYTPAALHRLRRPAQPA